MQLKTLSNDSLHPIGIGTWGIGGKREPEHGHESAEIDAIRYSISKGQNHIDTAELYGGGYTDEIVGQAIEKFDRKKLFIADKLSGKSVTANKVRGSVSTMLKKLGTDYIDLLYIHAPWEGVPWYEAIPQINELIDEGLVRYFGVSNFSVAQMEKTAKLSKHPIVVNQIHFNVIYKEDAPNKLLVFCKERDIEIVAYSPVERTAVEQNEVIQRIATAHNMSTEQIALAWLINQEFLTIPKAVQKSHIDQNVAAADLILTPAEMGELNDL